MKERKLGEEIMYGEREGRDFGAKDLRKKVEKTLWLSLRTHQAKIKSNFWEGGGGGAVF